MTILPKIIYGFKDIKEFDSIAYEKFASKAQSQINCTSIISTSEQFESFLNLAKDSIQRKNLYQPVQILYFEGNELKSYHINCYAQENIFKINWNKDNRFSTFPPKTAVDFSAYNIYLEKINAIFPEINNQTDKQFVIIIFWTNMLEKISYMALNTVIKNIEEYNKTNDCDLFIINTDKWYVSKTQN